MSYYLRSKYAVASQRLSRSNQATGRQPTAEGVKGKMTEVPNFLGKHPSANPVGGKTQLAQTPTHTSDSLGFRTQGKDTPQLRDPSLPPYMIANKPLYLLQRPELIQYIREFRQAAKRS